MTRIPPAMIDLSRYPLFSVGFRTLFPLACLAGLALPLGWVLMFAGAVPPAPSFVLPPLRWHAHEMFYGFGMAALLLWRYRPFLLAPRADGREH